MDIEQVHFLVYKVSIFFGTIRCISYMQGVMKIIFEIWYIIWFIKVIVHIEEELA